MCWLILGFRKVVPHFPHHGCAFLFVHGLTTNTLTVYLPCCWPSLFLNTAPWAPIFPFCLNALVLWKASPLNTAAYWIVTQDNWILHLGIPSAPFPLPCSLTLNCKLVDIFSYCSSFSLSGWLTIYFVYFIFIELTSYVSLFSHSFIKYLSLLHTTCQALSIYFWSKAGKNPCPLGILLCSFYSTDPHYVPLYLCSSNNDLFHSALPRTSSSVRLSPSIKLCFTNGYP